MLGKPDGILAAAASSWAEDALGESFDLSWELRKIDLTVLRTFSADKDSWEVAPVLLIEHENTHDNEVEAWNLASRRAKLQVLIFYFKDEADLAFKKSKIEKITRCVDADYALSGETLLLAAHLDFRDGVEWRQSIFCDGAFSEFRALRA